MSTPTEYMKDFDKHAPERKKNQRRPLFVAYSLGNCSNSYNCGSRDSK